MNYDTNVDAWAQDEAWDDDWNKPIRSDSRLRMWVGWGFGVVWNLLSLPLLFTLPEEISGGNHAAWIGLLFPLAGAAMLVYAVKRTREWTFYGPTELGLDPLPGSIGGHVGGVISLTAVAARQAFEVTLRCQRSYVSGSGKNRSRKSEVVWQAEGPAAVRTGGARPSLMFRFDIPAGLRPTEPKSDAYHYWEVVLTSADGGAGSSEVKVALDRTFRIPVFPGHRRSENIDVDTGASAEQSIRQQLRDAAGNAEEDAVNALWDAHGLAIERRGDWLRLHFPAGRNKLAAAMVVVVGAVFAGVGFGLLGEEAGGFMRAIFGGIGLIAVGAGIYMPLNSLDVRIHPDQIRAGRRFLGFRLSHHEFRPAELAGMKVKKGSTTTIGSRTIVHYNLIALLKDRRKVKVAEGIDGQSAARALRDLFMEQAGVRRSQ